MAPWRRQPSRRHRLGMWRSGCIALEVREVLLHRKKHNSVRLKSFALRMQLISQCIHP